MRITGGSLSGRKLFAPTTNAIRPMRDAVRMALFNILGERVQGSRFLDLFAGTGSVGIEALSRGASDATFVDELPAALEAVDGNLSALGVSDQGHIIAGDVFGVLEHLAAGSAFDLVFVGPPYGQGLADRTLQALDDHPALATEALVITEVFFKEPLAQAYGALVQVDQRRYGDNVVAFYSALVSP